MIVLYLSWLYRIEVPPGSVTAATPEASVIDADDWRILCAEAGGEDLLMASLNVTEAENAV